jgi:aminoglycoside phosphotransferase (APT) family kinase protein
MNAENNPLVSLLDAVACRHLPGARGIANFRRLSGGANLETWSFDALTDGGSIPLVLRRAPGGSRETKGNLLALETEAQVIEVAGKAGIPAPEVRYVLKPEDGVGQGFIMGRVEGETIARKILRDVEFDAVRPKLARQCGRILAALHSVDKTTLPPLRLSTADVETARYVETYRGYNYPHPVFEYALRWLQENLPSKVEAPTLVHGDFRHGNLIIGPDGVRAVLDWEIAHIGDPMEDLAWICVNSWRFGNIDLPVGGFGTREELFAGYEEGGRRADPERVKFWEVLGTLKWGVGCMGMVATFQSGADRSVERAAIGRRSSETEVDLLRLLVPRR